MLTDQAVAPLFREQAKQIEGIDIEIYQQFGRDPLAPIIGLGDPNSRVGFFGRDPGRNEVEHQQPFIGAGGQQVRKTLYRHLYGQEMPDFAASKAVGQLFFWANTVPYKPVKNKAWPMKVKKRFKPLMVDILTQRWRGQHLITLGREAFLWFGINQPREERQRLEAFWGSEERFTSAIDITLANEHDSRVVHLHPLPHPSPLNATWYKRFPDLLRQRLESLEVDLEHLNLPA